MIAKQTDDGVCWEWVCKSYKEKQYEGKTTGYYTIKEEGNDKVLAFRRPIFLDEDRYPEGLVRVKNEDILRNLDKKLAESLGQREEPKQVEYEKSELEDEALRVFD